MKDGEAVKYIFGNNMRIAQIKGSKKYFFHKDHLGSSAVMSNVIGVSVESTEYMPYGKTRAHTGTDLSDYKFTDQELDKSTDFYNYDARLYDPLIGRFIIADSIVPNWSDPQNLNRYAYCRNNPLIYVDPSGHENDFTGLITSYFETSAAYRNSYLSGFSGAVGKMAYGSMYTLTHLDYAVYDTIDAIENWGETLTNFQISIDSYIDKYNNASFEEAAKMDGELALYVPATVLASEKAIDEFSSIFKASSTSNVVEDFFVNTKFTDKVLKQMEQGDFHSFPRSVEGFQSAGEVTEIIGSDGVTKEMLKIPGGYKGREGMFEFIKEADGTINHRFFNPNSGQ